MELLERLAAVSTTSLADAGKGVVRILPRELRPVRGGLRLLGHALTAVAKDDLMSVVAALRIAGPGDVLMISGGEDGAVCGELFAGEARRRGVTGLVIDGYCRDRATLMTLDLPVYARGSLPNAPGARSLPIVQVPITMGGVPVNPGDLVVGDADGLVLGTPAELAAVIAAAEEIETFETALRDRIQAGSPLLDHLNYDEHLAALKAGRESGLSFS